MYLFNIKLFIKFEFYYIIITFILYLFFELLTSIILLNEINSQICSILLSSHNKIREIYLTRQQFLC